MTVLQCKSGFFVGEAEFLRFRPHGSNLSRGATRAHEFNGRVEILATPFIRIVHRVRGVPDGETAVIAGAVSHVGMENVVIHGISGPEDAVRENVGVRIAALAGDGVHGFYILGTEIVEHLAYQTHGLVFAHARLHRTIEFVVSSVHHHGGRIQQRDLVSRLDKARFRHERLAIHYRDSFLLQSKENGQLDDVDPHRFFMQAAHFELDANLFRHIFRAPHLGRHGAAQHGDSGARPLSEPGTMQLVVFRRRSEIPQNRLVVLRKQREAVGFVLRPCSNVCRRQVADVIHVEAEKGAHLRFL